MTRDVVFDRARGLAILIMLVANAAPLMMDGFQPYFGFRALCSLAAPLFVIVCAMLISLHAERRTYKYYLQRAVFIVATGALVDMAVNHLLPFKGVDILYLVGVSIPLIYLAQKVRTCLLCCLMGVIFASSVLLRHELGYQALPLQMGLDGVNQAPGNNPLIWKHWLVDGWFPLFPWLGIAFSGILFKRWRYPECGARIRHFTQASFVFSQAIFVVVGVALSLFYPSAYYMRYGYIELFYPPSLGFCFTAIGSVGLVLALCEWLQPSKALSNIEIIGNMPLAMYILHLMVISYILHPLLAPITTIWLYALACVFIAWILVLCSRKINRIRASYPNLPVAIRWIIGK